MSKGFGQIRWFLRELRRRNVYKVAVTYAVVGYALMELADLVFVRLGLPEWTVTFVIVVIAIGFPLAIIIAWAFELTPEGVAPTPSRDDAGASLPGEDEQPARGSGSGWLVVVAMAGLAVVAVVAGGRYLVDDADEAEPRISDRSIAVLPFEQLGQSEPDVFTEGMHDDLLARLSNLSGLKVISRTSVQQYRGTRKTVAEIARELGVRWVLEGGVQEMGDQIQVNAQLIDPTTDTHAWADSYRRDLTAEDLFAIQGEISNEIAEALKTELTAGEQERIVGAPTDNLVAYRLYAQGRRLLDQHALSEAGLKMNKALQEDSTFALAWAGLADVLGGGAWGGGDRPDSLEFPDVTQMEAAQRSVELDPDLAEGRAALGYAHLEARNAPAALREARRAVELKPSFAQGHQLLGTVLQVIGRFEEALRHFQIAEELNPRHLVARHRLFDALNMSGKPEKALAEVREQQKMFGYEGAAWAEIRALRALDRPKEAIELTQKQLGASENVVERTILHSYLVGLEAETGDMAEAQRHLEAMQEIPLPPEQRRKWSWIFASAHSELENFDEAFREIRLEDWDSVIPTISLRHEDNPLRQDPRYRELIRKLNRHWNLNPDGSLPDDVDVSLDAQSDG